MLVETDSMDRKKHFRNLVASIDAHVFSTVERFSAPWGMSFLTCVLLRSLNFVANNDRIPGLMWYSPRASVVCMCLAGPGWLHRSKWFCNHNSPCPMKGLSVLLRMSKLFRVVGARFLRQCSPQPTFHILHQSSIDHWLFPFHDVRRKFKMMTQNGTSVPWVRSVQRHTVVFTIGAFTYVTVTSNSVGNRGVDIEAHWLLGSFVIVGIEFLREDRLHIMTKGWWSHMSLISKCPPGSSLLVEIYWYKLVFVLHYIRNKLQFECGP